MIEKTDYRIPPGAFLLKRNKTFRFGRAISTLARLANRDLRREVRPRRDRERQAQMQRRWDWLIASIRAERLRLEDATEASFDRQSRLPHPRKKADD